jgi:hypothetical protein
MRWLEDGVPDQADVHLSTGRVEPGEAASFVRTDRWRAFAPR